MTRGVRLKCVVGKVESLYERCVQTTTGYKNSAASSWRQTITVNKSLVCEPEDGKKATRFDQTTS